VAKVSISEAARRLGVSSDTIRRRIGRGELVAHQEATPQGYRWEIEIDLSDQPLNGHDSNLEALVTALQSQIQGQTIELDARRREVEDKQAQVQAQAEELDARRREVQELHVLLQTAQAVLTAPKSRPWWRWWG